MFAIIFNPYALALITPMTEAKIAQRSTGVSYKNSRRHMCPRVLCDIHTHALHSGGPMRFQHRMFNIECSATDGVVGFIGEAIIWRAPPDAKPEGAFRSGNLSSFPTYVQAIGFARFWAEIWCDEADGLGGSQDNFSYERLLLPIAKPSPPERGQRQPTGTLKRRP